MNLLERTIAAVAPSWAAARAESRARLQGYKAMSRAYDGARKDRLYGNWRGGGESADGALLQALPQLRQRCRDLNRNNPIAAAITNGIVRNVVGSGMRVQSRIDPDAAGISAEEARKLGRIAEGLFRRWEQFAAADERTDFAGLQRLAQRKKTEDGEVFARGVLVDRPGRPFRTAIEVIEADRVQTPGSIDDDRTRAGVVLGRSGQPVAYHVLLQHPGDGHLRRGATQRKFRKIAAWDGQGGRAMVHLYRVKRPGQTRGEPRLAPVMTSLHDLGQVLEAERIAKRIEACLAGFIKRDPATWQTSDRTDPETGGMRVDFEPGMFEMLMPGESVDLVQSNRPGTTFDPYVKLMVRTVGAAVEMPLEVLLLDYSESSWSSARAAVLEARRGWETEQQELARGFCQWAYGLVLEEAYLAGDFPVSDFYGLRHVWTAAEWLPDGWRWVDPLKEAQAVSAALAAGVSNLGIESARVGVDWEDNLRATLLIEKRTQELRQELGLAAPPAPPPVPGEPGAEADPAAEEQDPEDGDSDPDQEQEQEEDTDAED